MADINIHPKFNKAYEAIVKTEITGSLGSSTFKAGEAVTLALAITQRNLEYMVEQKLKAFRRSLGGDGVMFEGEAVELTAEKFSADILADINNYTVYAISDRRDTACNYAEAKTLFSLTGNIYKGLAPESVVMDNIASHNMRVW